MLESKAGFRLEGDQNITVVATDDSELPVAGVRLRNKQTWAPESVRREDAQTFVGAIVVEAAGRFATAEDAVAVLANLANPYLQVLAVIANAAVEEPEDLMVYAPPEVADGEGEFLVQRHSQPRAPAARLRPLAAKDAMAVLQALQVHPRAERLHRAMAHVRMALNHLAPESRVLSAESLWMAI